MIFGVSLKEYERLLKLGDKAYPSQWTKRLLLKQHKSKFKVRNILDMTFSEFVDAERHLERSEYAKFCRIFIKKDWLQRVYVRFCRKFGLNYSTGIVWQRVYFHNLEPIVKEYGRQKQEMAELYRYVYNPPVYGEPQSETNGDELRKEFVQEFGNLVVLMDKVMSWDKTGFKAIEQWKVSEFFFWANYLTAQRIVENVK